MKFEVGFIGNFEAPFSTENELAYTFRDLGWDVIELQENKASTDDIMNLSPDLLLYVHTHGWETPGQFTIDNVIESYRERNIVTASFHLDRYWGLDVLDKRETLIGQHPFWHTEYVFTADGNHQKEFAERGVRHIWLPPAVALRRCFKGTPREEYKCDVAFVGSRFYHPEYLFREQLVAWLDEPHPFTVKRWGGDRNGVREELNDIYASAKIVVGDSCFAGTPYYWSDRVFEVVGRNGFLLHPKSDGMVVPMANYAAQSLTDLQDQIDYYLAHEAEREEVRECGFDWVKANETYHNRVISMLTLMGLN